MTSIADKQKQLVEDFNDCLDWREKYELILERGEDYLDKKPLKDSEKLDENLVPGCVSKLWLVSDFRDGKIYYRAQSDSMLVQGLAAIAVDLFSGHSPEEILEASVDFVNSTGLSQNLTPSRSNGVASLIQTIKEQAKL